MTEHTDSIPPAAAVTRSSDDSRYVRGMATMRSLFGSGIDDALQTLAGNSPDLARYLVEFPFAEIYTRGCLDLRTREMLTITALTVLGYAQAELKDHIRSAINVGCAKGRNPRDHPPSAGADPHREPVAAQALRCFPSARQPAAGCSFRS